jgi:hypothetical protein
MMENSNKNNTLINGTQSDNENDNLINKDDNNDDYNDDIIIPYKDDINNDEKLLNLNENEKV